MSKTHSYQTTPTKRLRSRLLYRLTPAKAATVAAVMAVIGMIGQISNIQRFKIVIDGFPAMSVSTSVGLLLLSVLLGSSVVGVAVYPARRFVRIGIAALVALLAAANLAATALQVNRGVMSAAIGLPSGIKSLFVSSPYTAACLMLLAISLILQEDKRPRTIRYGQTLVMLTLAMLLFVSMGYLFSVSVMYRIDDEIGMAVHTWLGLIFLSVGCFNRHQSAGMPLFYYGHGMGSEMFRRLLPTMSLITTAIALGGAKLQVSVFSEDSTKAYAVFAILTFVVSTWAIWHTAARVNQLESELEQERSRFQELFEGNPDAVLVFDATGHVIEANRQAAALTGYSHEQMLGKTAEDFVPQSIRDRHLEHRLGFAEAPLSRIMGSGMKLALRCADGHDCPVDISIRPARFNVQEVIILSIRDQSAVRELEEQIDKLDHDVYHDSLTALPNRRMLMLQLHQILSRAKRHQHEIAVCFCDLDGFKSVNDDHGHRAGDAVLEQVAKRMNTSVREEDIVARLGGDEPPRDLRRLFSLRGLSHEQDSK